eukprot:4022980-Pyramimonas_sp.AAC.1
MSSARSAPRLIPTARVVPPIVSLLPRMEEGEEEEEEEQDEEEGTERRGGGTEKEEENASWEFAGRPIPAAPFAPPTRRKYMWDATPAWVYPSDVHSVIFLLHFSQLDDMLARKN